MRPPKIVVSHNGKNMTLRQYSELSGVPISALRQRRYCGRPVVQDRDTMRYQHPTSAKRKPATKYTPEEIAELYTYFAGQTDELQILMDFTLLPEAKAKALLEELQHRRKRPCLY